ncbi:hypothetical protein AB2B38_012400 [Balneola sp. MJW-20]|uniref:hypothetical protein n=1 Tax=Gracilimonas aurantiaca TaxID=3234185 RepID=UPI003466A590
MATKRSWSEIMIVGGFIAILVGAIDPMEGSLLILPGSAMIALGSYLQKPESGYKRFHLWMFILILIGVAALWGVSWYGGVGGEQGLSGWWAILFLPYLAGWTLSVWGPDSPRWVLWAGILVSIWYLSILIMALTKDFFGQDPAMIIAPLVLSALAIITISGCIWRIRRTGIRTA